MNGSVNAGHSSGFGSPQGKFVQRLCVLEEDNKKLNQQLRDLLEWKSSVEEYLVDNLDYRPPGAASVNSGNPAALGSEGIRTSTDDDGSNHSEASNLTFPMNNGDENTRNTRRPVVLNHASAPDTTPDLRTASAVAGSSRATQPVSFATLKHEIPSPSPDITDWNGRDSGEYNNDTNHSMLEDEDDNGNGSIMLEDEDEDANGNENLGVPDDGIEDEEENPNNAGIWNQTNEASTILIPGRSLQTSDEASRSSGTTNSTVSKKKKKRDEVGINEGRTPQKTGEASTSSGTTNSTVSKKKKKRGEGSKNLTLQSPSRNAFSVNLSEVSDSLPCDVCRLPHAGEENEMVLCDGCNVCVHQKCYGIAVIPEGEWRCRICIQGLLPHLQVCRFCTTVGGAMIPVQSPAKKHWAHVSCTWWIPGPSINNPDKVDFVIGLPQIEKGRWNLTCYICKKGKGTTCCIQCAYKRCTKAFHVTCGFKKGIPMQMTEDDDIGDGISFVSYCDAHRDVHKSMTTSGGGQRKKRRLQQEASTSASAQSNGN